jgi:probable rRNA maturation factor
MIELSYDAECALLPPDGILAAMRKAGRAAVLGHGMEDAEISLSFVSPERIRALNREHRGVDAATDVLSFPMAGLLNQRVQLGVIKQRNDDFARQANS